MSSLPAHARVFQAFDSGGLKTIHIESKTRDHNDQHEANSRGTTSNLITD
jgi:hypothetical protein